MEYKKKSLLKFDETEVSNENYNEDDFGFEIDETGMIPKLEELKAIGNSKVEEDIKEESAEDEFETIYNLNALDDLDDDIFNLGFSNNSKENDSSIPKKEEGINSTEERQDLMLKELRRIADALEKIADKI